MFKRMRLFALLRIAMLVGALAGLLGATSAHAALYAFVDEQGQTHFASEALDARYQLFLQDGAVADLSQAAQNTHLGKTGKPSAMMQRMLRHPNLVKVEPLIKKLAKQYSVDAALIKAVIAAESGFNAAAVSPKGAIGLMQVIPETGQRYGVQADKKRTVEQKLTDPTINLPTGVRYLRDLLKLFSGKQDLALAAYNAGEGAVQKYRNQIPPYPETQNYVKTVLQLYQLYGPALIPAQAGQRINIKIGGRRNMPE